MIWVETKNYQKSDIADLLSYRSKINKLRTYKQVWRFSAADKKSIVDKSETTFLFVHKNIFDGSLIILMSGHCMCF